MTTPRDFAVAYAERGWPVFPLWPIRLDGCGCPDPRCGNAGKHPLTKGWPNSIASIPAAKRVWGGHLGERGIGVALGARARMWALDIDPRHGGVEALQALERDYGALPVSLRVATGGGGLHVYFRWPDDGLPVSNANGLPPGLDTRGEGGFTVLPPSQHVSGGAYKWLTLRHARLESAPAWLLELVRQRQRSLPAIKGGASALIPRGQWHNALVSLLGLMRNWGAGPEVLDAAAAALAEHQFIHDNEPIDWEHIHATARDIARRY